MYLSLLGVANSETFERVFFLFLQLKYDVVNDIRENAMPNFESELTVKFSGHNFTQRTHHLRSSLHIVFQSNDLDKYRHTKSCY